MRKEPNVLFVISIKAGGYVLNLQVKADERNMYKTVIKKNINFYHN